MSDRTPGAGARAGAGGADPSAHEALEAARRAARARLEAATAEHEAIVAASEGSNADDEHDPEGSTIAYERARTAALRAQALADLAELDLALERLRAGVPPTCEVCGGVIPAERLDALPATRTCVTCAARR
jgi:RNA polymerase-binding transcription factor DksA